MHIDADGKDLFERIKGYLGAEDRQLVRQAYEVAAAAHGQQARQSGEPYITHPLTVAYYLAKYRLDAPTLVAALLHDVAEDTVLSIAEIRSQFGPAIGHLVDGVTKLKEVSGQGASPDKEEVQAASMHKFFEAMTTDPRVVLIKLFDRLHNMQTVSALAHSKQQRKARETLAIYAPLANRLGIWRVKSELEALSLLVLDREAYERIKHSLELQFLSRQPTYDAITREAFDFLGRSHVPVVDIRPLPESIYSVYRAINEGSRSFERVESPLRIVVLLEDVTACYLALCYVHRKWQAVPGKFDDYISRPRDNLYKALHTTVIYSDGQVLKVRFLKMGI
jgi:GTP pyrophosphokinase